MARIYIVLTPINLQLESEKAKRQVKSVCVCVHVWKNFYEGYGRVTESFLQQLFPHGVVWENSALQANSYVIQ